MVCLEIKGDFSNWNYKVSIAGFVKFEKEFRWREMYGVCLVFASRSPLRVKSQDQVINVNIVHASIIKFLFCP